MLQQERKKVSFDVNDLSNVIYGSPEAYKEFLEIQKKVTNDPILRFNPEHIQISRKELFEVMAKKLIRYHQLFEVSPAMKSMQNLFFNQTMPLAVHFAMFYSVLRNLCTEKQKKLFLEPTYDGKIMGCYAQTQLGHGSDVQNIETTATYDIESESFIMNTPTQSAIKWWIGDLGVLANHACVMAQLIIKGKRYGPHAFVVNIRDMQTHKPLPGVEVGDIGPKFGYNAKDNGYLKFNNLKIPRDNMLSRYSKVHKDGQYQRRGNQKISYATMLIIRSGIPKTCHWGLSIATTIITRYSLVRKQFKNDAGQQIQILDYQLQQDKVIPFIAELYALLFGSRRLVELGNEVLHDAQQKNDFTKLNPTHALSSGLKAIFTADCLKALETIRRAAGGHGFSSYSGIPLVHSELAPTVTYEGENTILHLQTARFIIKGLQNIRKGKPVVDIVEHLKQASKFKTLQIEIKSVQDFFNPETIRRIMMNNSYFRAVAASQKVIAGIGEGLSPKESWDYYSGLSLVEASTAFIYYWIFNNFFEHVYAVKYEAVRKSLIKVLCLYGVHKILEYSGSYYEAGVLSSQATKLVFSAKEQLLSELRNDAIGLVEAYGYDDNTLKSAIGRRDGKAYETLLEWARKHNRVNRPQAQKQFLDLMNANKGKIQLAKL